MEESESLIKVDVISHDKSNDRDFYTVGVIASEITYGEYHRLGSFHYLISVNPEFITISNIKKGSSKESFTFKYYNSKTISSFIKGLSLDGRYCSDEVFKYSSFLEEMELYLDSKNAYSKRIYNKSLLFKSVLGVLEEYLSKENHKTYDEVYMNPIVELSNKLISVSPINVDKGVPIKYLNKMYKDNSKKLKDDIKSMLNNFKGYQEYELIKFFMKDLYNSINLGYDIKYIISLVENKLGSYYADLLKIDLYSIEFKLACGLLIGSWRDIRTAILEGEEDE